MNAFRAFTLLGPWCLVAFADKKCTSIPDHTSFLQHSARVQHASTGNNVEAVGYTKIESQDEADAPSLKTAECKDTASLQFHHGRNCENFTEAELDLPLTTWPPLTRWCKMAHFDQGLNSDQCFAQYCIGREDPALAARVWWNTKVKYSELYQGIEYTYCQLKGLCSSPLNRSSTLQNMEQFCDDRIQDWRNATPRDTLKWLAAGFKERYENVDLITCSWGTLHCDATRCQQYFCGTEAQNVALMRMGKLETPVVPGVGLGSVNQYLLSTD